MTDIFSTLKENIRGYWDFRSNSLYDFSGENHPYVGNNCYYGEGGISLDGNGYLDVSNQVAVDENVTLSVVALVKPRELNPAGQNIVLSQWASLNRFFMDIGALKLRFFIKGATQQFETSVAPIPITDQVCLGASYDGNALTNKLYINGVLAPSSPNGTIPASLNASTDAVRIGSIAPTGSWKGAVAAVMIFDKALSQAEHAAVCQRLESLEWPAVTSNRLTDGTFFTDWGTNESLVNRTSQYLENSEWQVGSGTWKISSELVNGKITKVFDCIAPGRVYLPVGIMGQTPAQGAYGEWGFWVKKQSGNNPVVSFVSSDFSASSGYSVDISDANTLINEIGVGAVVTSSTNVSNNTWTKIDVSRDPSGNFEIFINNTSTGTGTDTTLMTSQYAVLDLDAGDAVAYASLDGNINFYKKL